jgi:hypothetical protein
MMQRDVSSALEPWTGWKQPRLGALSSSTDLKMPDRGVRANRARLVVASFDWGQEYEGFDRVDESEPRHHR